jgi:hypothetical protein
MGLHRLSAWFVWHAPFYEEAKLLSRRASETFHFSLLADSWCNEAPTSQAGMRILGNYEDIVVLVVSLASYIAASDWADSLSWVRAWLVLKYVCVVVAAPSVCG